MVPSELANLRADIQVNAEDVAWLASVGIRAIDYMVHVRAECKAKGKYGLADQMRGFLTDLGVELRDGPEGTAWFRADPNPEATARFRAWLASMSREKDRRLGMD